MSRIEKVLKELSDLRSFYIQLQKRKSTHTQKKSHGESKSGIKLTARLSDIEN